MPTLHLKDEVRKALTSEWPDFAHRHPRLAAVIDQTLLVDQAVTSLADDPDYQAAMEDAALAGVAAETLSRLVRRFVAGFLGRLT